MKNLIIISISLTLLACNDFRTENKKPESNSIDSSTSALNTDERVLSEAKITRGNAYRPEEFQIELQEQTISIDIYGNLTSGHFKKSIDLGKGFYTHKIHYYDNDKQVIIFFEVTDDDGSFNEIYSLDKQTLKIVWKAEDLLSFNLTVGKSDKDILYLGAGNIAWALDIKTGKLIWEVVGLYRLLGINYFDSIELTDNEVYLTGKSHPRNDKEVIKTFILNRKEGKAMGIK